MQKQAKVPSDFPLKSFHNFPNFSLDTECYKVDFDGAKKAAEEWINQNYVLSAHPEWLFRRGEKNRRGPFYDVLKSVLEVDKELETLQIRKKAFVKIVHDVKEYERNIVPSDEFIEKLGERGIDVFTFLDRKWCCPIPNPPNTWNKTDDNVGLLEIKDYASWWTNVGKKTRNMVRRAEKSGIKVTVVQPSEKLAEGIWKIYNETLIRQDRAFPHYGEQLQTVAGNMFAGAQKSTFIGALLQEAKLGFSSLQDLEKLYCSKTMNSRRVTSSRTPVSANFIFL